ncbi:unnamed protein product [Cuscuta epithymum]|nr:unnamed protein product [Cuscuta epithymum]CAH9128081.1 unnamed protein product [Cuscuta epithymum]
MKQKAMKTVSGISGLESIAMDRQDKKLTLIGDIDPVKVVAMLRKFCRTEIFSVGPAKEEEKKKTEEPKKVEEKKKEGDQKKQDGGKQQVVQLPPIRGGSARGARGALAPASAVRVRYRVGSWRSAGGWIVSGVQGLQTCRLGSQQERRGRLCFLLKRKRCRFFNGQLKKLLRTTHGQLGQLPRPNNRKPQFPKPLGPGYQQKRIPNESLCIIQLYYTSIILRLLYM